MFASQAVRPRVYIYTRARTPCANTCVYHTSTQNPVYTRDTIWLCAAVHVYNQFFRVSVGVRRACAEMHLCSFAVEKLALGKAAGKSFVKSAIDGPSY